MRIDIFLNPDYTSVLHEDVFDGCFFLMPFLCFLIEVNRFLNLHHRID